MTSHMLQPQAITPGKEQGACLQAEGGRAFGFVRTARTALLRAALV